MSYHSNQPQDNLEDFIDDESNDSNSNFSRKLNTYVKNIFIIFVIGFLVYNAYYINDVSQRAVETRFGKLIRITGPGLHFKLPFIESYQQYQLALQRLLPKNKVLGEIIPMDKVSTASADNYELHGKIRLLYRLPEDQVEYIYRNIPDFKELLEYLVKKMFKEEIGKIDMIEVPEKRGEMAKNVIKKLKQKIQEINLNIELYDFSMPYYDWDEEFLGGIQEIESIKSATRKAKSQCQKTIITAKKIKIEMDSKVNKTLAGARVKTIHTQIQMSLNKIKAENEAEIKKITAKSEATAIEIKGKAQADALKAQGLALVENPGLIELEKIKRWDGKLPDCQKTQGIFPFMTQGLPTTLLHPFRRVKEP